MAHKKSAAKTTSKAKSKKATARTPPKAVAKAKAKSRRAKPVKGKQAAAAKKRPRKPTPARDARRAAAMKTVIAQVIAPAENGRAVVDAYLRDVDHPFQAEMLAVRAIILGASPKIGERIKWNAPSFYYKRDLGAFNPRAREFAHLILLFPDGLGMPAKSALLEGKHHDRREAKFYSLADVEAKQGALERLVKAWVRLQG
jgi:hypothetical protein